MGCLITFITTTSLIIIFRRKRSRATDHPENPSNETAEPVYEDIDVQEVNKDELKTEPNVCYDTGTVKPRLNADSIEPVYTVIDRLYSVVLENTTEACNISL